MLLLGFATPDHRAHQRPGLVSQEREEPFQRQVGNSIHDGCRALPLHWPAWGHGGKWVLLLPRIVAKNGDVERLCKVMARNRGLGPASC